MDKDGRKHISEQVYTVKEIMEILKIGRKKAYELVHEGHFKCIRIGKDIRINKQSFEEWLENGNQ